MNAVYARQSVEKLDSLSIETQIDSCVRNLDGAYTVYQDRGFSGKNIKRPAFTQLLEDVRNGRVSKVWVYRLDRFSRSLSDFGQLWAILEHHHVEFESVTEKFDTSTPSGRAMLNIIMAFAQLERETIAERVRDNYYHRFALGGWPGGPAPLGFDIGRTTDPVGRHVPALVPNEQTDLIQWIYEAYLAPRASCGSIAKSLTAAGIPGIRRNSWDNVAISRILKNPVYVMADREIYLYFCGKQIPVEQPVEAFTGVFGCHLVGKRDRAGTGRTAPRLSLANHPGVISSDMWLACQEKLDQNRQLDRTHAGKYSWLSGLMKCAQCGYSIKISHVHGAFYLYCSGHTNLNTCDQRISVDLRELEREVERELTGLLENCPEENSVSPENGQLRQIDARIGRLMAAYGESSAVTAQYLDREIIKLDGERQRLFQKKQGARTDALSRIEFSTLTLAEKKMVAACFLDRVLLSEDTAEVIWRI